MKFTPQGDLKVTITVPFADKHLAVPLSEAYGLQLELDVRRRRRRKR